MRLKSRLCVLILSTWEWMAAWAIALNQASDAGVHKINLGPNWATDFSPATIAR